MTKSIRNKLIFYFLLIVLIVTFVFFGFLWFIIRDNYYSLATGILERELNYSIESYYASHSDVELSEVILNDYFTFYDTDSAQVQILNVAGEVLFDSIGDSVIGKVLNAPEVLISMSGEKASNIFRNSTTKEAYLSVSGPLNNREKQVGIIRFVSSLHLLEEEIVRMTSLFILFILGILFISGIAIFIMSNSIVNPINQLTNVASRMARGHYSVRADEDGDDEITALGRTMNTLSDNIVEKEQIKNEFISSISHELRTPLTSIKGWAITLKGEVEDNESIMNQGLDIIETESDRLSRMVEELLDFSSYVSGKTNLSKEWINVTDLLKSIVIQLGPRAEGLSIDLDFHYEDENIMAMIDKNRIKQVIINILDNSLKFTPEDGKIYVHLKENNDDFVVKIKDTGVGISPEDIRYVTTRFYKGNHSQSHIGLGLSISEEIVSMHGGKFTIESILGKETAVLIEIPKGKEDQI